MRTGQVFLQCTGQRPNVAISLGQTSCQCNSAEGWFIHHGGQPGALTGQCTALLFNQAGGNGVVGIQGIQDQRCQRRRMEALTIEAVKHRRDQLLGRAFLRCNPRIEEQCVGDDVGKISRFTLLQFGQQVLYSLPSEFASTAGIL